MRVDLAFKRGGYVESLLQVRGADGIARSVQEGDLVASGAVLATLRQSDYVDKRTQAEAQLREAEASLSHATSESERAGRLFATGSLTKRDYDAAQTQVDVIRAKRDGARALVQEAQNAVADTNLASPIDGVVLKRLVEVGSLAGPGTPGFVIADSRRVKVVFGAPDRIVEPGQSRAADNRDGGGDSRRAISSAASRASLRRRTRAAGSSTSRSPSPTRIAG